MTELLYIDEEPREGRRVIRLAANSKYFEQDQVAFIEPLPSLDETVESIFSSGCAALITDFRLGEKVDNIDYTGTDLIKKIRESSKNFPCFITTSFPEDAIKTDVDAFNIFFKEDIDESEEEGGSRITFFQRVRKEVERTKKRAQKLTCRHEELVSLSKERELTQEETEEFIEIDTELDENLSYKTSAPAHAKSVALDGFEELVASTQNLIKEVQISLSHPLKNDKDS